MGKCFSCVKEGKDTNEEKDVNEEEIEAKHEEVKFEEGEKRKSLDDQKPPAGGARIKFKRRSSGLSRYSTNEQHVVEQPFRIAAFNIQRFGAAKMKDKTVVRILVKIVLKFDIILIQEKS